MPTLRTRFMKNTITAPETLEKALCGKKIIRVEIHNSHGEVLEIVFEDGNRLHVCSTYGLADSTIKPDPHAIYVSLNGDAL